MNERAKARHDLLSAEQGFRNLTVGQRLSHAQAELAEILPTDAKWSPEYQRDLDLMHDIRRLHADYINQTGALQKRAQELADRV